MATEDKSDLAPQRPPMDRRPSAQGHQSAQRTQKVNATVSVTLKRTQDPIPSTALFAAIRKRTDALSYQNYSDFLEVILCGSRCPTGPSSPPTDSAGLRCRSPGRSISPAEGCDRDLSHGQLRRQARGLLKALGRCPSRRGTRKTRTGRLEEADARTFPISGSVPAQRQWRPESQDDSTWSSFRRSSASRWSIAMPSAR